MLLFNPPYVPTASEETFLPLCHLPAVFFSTIESAYAGGEKGREVIDALLPDVSVGSKGSCNTVHSERKRSVLFAAGASECP